MDNIAFNGLIDYLSGTYTPDELRYLGQELILRSESDESQYRQMENNSLNSLLVFLTESHNPDQLRYLGEELINRNQPEEMEFRPYTMEEVNAMIDEAEREIAAGDGIPHEEVFRELYEEIDRETAVENILKRHKSVQQESLSEVA